MNKHCPKCNEKGIRAVLEQGTEWLCLECMVAWGFKVHTHVLDEVQEQNRMTKKRLEEERKKNNAKVLKNYRIKK